MIQGMEAKEAQTNPKATEGDEYFINEKGEYGMRKGGKEYYPVNEAELTDVYNKYQEQEKAKKAKPKEDNETSIPDQIDQLTEAMKKAKTDEEWEGYHQRRNRLLQEWNQKYGE